MAVTRILLACALALATFSASAETIVLGKITTKASKHLPRLKGLGDYLGSQIEGVTFEARTVTSVKEAAELMARGEIHMMSETLYGALQIEEAGAGRIVLAELKGGLRFYTSMIVTHVDSDISTLQQLGGRLMAFEDIYSTSGYFIPRIELAKAGLTIQKKDETGPNVVRPKFLEENEENLVLAIATKRVDAAVIASKDWAQPDVVPPAAKAKLRILCESAPILRSTMIFSTAMPEKIGARIRAVLLAAHEDEQADEALTLYNKVKRYDPLTEEDVASLSEMRAILRDF